MRTTNTTLHFRLAVAITMLCIGVGGCSLSPIVQNNSLDYDNTIEDVANKSLVVNILRGRDSAPLYFPDLSQIRGSVTASVSTQGTIPYGPTFGTVQPGPFAAATNPTFDIAPTNTKQFYQGLLNPVSRNLFAYYVERARSGGSLNFVFYLLVKGVDRLQDGVTIDNIAWRDAEFTSLVDPWVSDLSHLPKVVPLPNDSSAVGPPLAPDAKAIVSAQAAGLDVSSVKNGMMQFKKKNSSVAICFYDAGQYIPIAIEDNSVVKPTSGDAPLPPDFSKSQQACAGHAGNKTSNNKKPAHSFAYRLQLRSVEEIFYFLGTLVDYVDTNDPRGLLATGHYAGCPIISFHIDRAANSGTRFSVAYRGQSYFVSDRKRKVPCGSTSVLDNTLPTLAILNDLLNLNRDAADVPTTKAVQTVGSGI